MAIFERDILEGRRRRAAEAFGSRVPTVLIGAGRANSQAWRDSTKPIPLWRILNITG